MEREAERIARANGMPSGSASSSNERDSEHRKRKRRRGSSSDPIDVFDDDDEHAQHAHERQPRGHGFMDGMGMGLDDDGDGGLFGAFPFGSAIPDFMSHIRPAFGMPGTYPFARQRIPNRFRPPPRPDPRDFFNLDGDRPPPMGGMSADEYAAHLRARFRADQRAADLEEAARRGRAAREEAERAYRARRVAEEREDREEREARRRRKARADAAEASSVAAARAEARAAEAEERARWRRRCTALFDAEVLSVQLSFADIPWPVSSARGAGFSIVLTPADLTEDNVRAFLYSLADAEAEPGKKTEARRKVLRDAIRLFHSDRFDSRILPRVREEERETVREGVGVVARILTDLLSKQ